MNESEYRRLRANLLSGGEAPPELISELRQVAGRLIRSRALPPRLAPYGVWNEEATDEVFQAWTTTRLLGRGDLRGIVARSGSVGVLRALAERSLRQFLLNERARSEAQNLFRRVREQLRDDEAFRCFIESPRSQNAWWGLSAWDERPPFNDDARQLRRAAWSVEDLTVIRYSAIARKLSPLLDREELNRFLHGLFKALHALLTITHIMNGLRERLALDSSETVPFEAAPEPGRDEDVAGELAIRETALLAVAELSSRQVRVLVATAAGRPLAAIGASLGCSAATVLNEQNRVGAVIRRLSADNEEQELLLKTVTDLLYLEGEHDVE
jgi:DNA-binding CsgD family transcriptional regulator